MYRTLIATCAIVSGATIFYACSDSPAGNDSDNGSNEPTEFSASVTSPANGDILEGVVTITAEAEASGGIEEVRFFLGDDLLFSADSSPFEYEIDTREYPNGTHEIRIEAAMAEADSVITETVSVELENYMVELETERLVTNFNTNVNTNSEWIMDSGLYLFISAPDGRVLAEEELTQDGLLQLLPPEALSDGAPEYYQLTIAQFVNNIEGPEVLNLTTEAALESWTSFRIEAAAGSENDLFPTQREVDVELINIQDDPLAFIFLSPLTSRVFDYEGGSPAEPFRRPMLVGVNQDQLILTSIPSVPPYAEGVTPRYYWDKDLEGAGSVLYDVAEQFETMSVHAISYPSNIQSTNVTFNMSVEQDSWEAGSVSFQGYFFSQATPSGMKMYVPNLNHRYRMHMSGTDASASDIRYYQGIRGALPASFEALNAKVTVTSSSLDNVKMQTSGTMDFVHLAARASAQDFSYQYSWNVFQADTATSFIFPRIADSLDQKISHYNRSEFQVTHLEMTDYADIDGYEEYREYRTSAEEGSLYEYQSISKLLNTGQQKRKTWETDEDAKSGRNQQEAPLSPPYRLIKY